MKMKYLTFFTASNQNEANANKFWLADLRCNENKHGKQQWAVKVTAVLQPHYWKQMLQRSTPTGC